MKWKIDYDEISGLVIVTCEGPFSAEDCIAFKKDYIAGEHWHPDRNILIDYRGATFQNVKLSDLERAALFHTEKNSEIGSGRMALLMNTLTHFGLARQYELLTEHTVNSELMVFQDEEKARRWLLEG